METWAEQINEFIQVVAIGDDQISGDTRDVFLICNSIGGVAGLSAAKTDSTSEGGRGNISGIVLLNVSLRMLHEKKQQPWQKPLVRGFQKLLRETALGEAFFRSVATAQGVRSVLREAYNSSSSLLEAEEKDAVDDILVSNILNPGLLPGAVRVFLDFISYSGGPLPEDLLDSINIPSRIIWGKSDPWEPISLAEKEFKERKSVEDFIVLDNVGHCPMDQAPKRVNPLLTEFVFNHSKVTKA